MILDNRTAVPDIIVSREGVPNNLMCNVNNNVRGGIPHRENMTPKGASKKVRDPPKPQYVTGNNNGSPLHAPRNGNIFKHPDHKSGIPLRSPHRPLVCSSNPGSPVRRIRRNPLQKYPAEQTSPKRLNVDKESPWPRRRDSVPSRVFDFSSGEFSDSLNEVNSGMPISRIPTTVGIPQTIHGSSDCINPKRNSMNVTYTKEDFSSLNKLCRPKTPRRDRNSMGLSDASVSSRDSLEGSSAWNWNQRKWNMGDLSHSWDTDGTDRSEEDNRKMQGELKFHKACRNSNGSYSDDASDYASDSEEIKLLTDEDVSYYNNDTNLASKMVVIKCQEKNYLTRILVDKKGIHGVKIVGRLGSSKSKGMSADSAFVSPRDAYYREGDSRGPNGQAFESEFEHEAADYQWLLDYDDSYERYRESFSKDSLCSTRENVGRVSVLQTPESKPELNYETISRNLDANLAEIDMDDFRSEDINQLLTLPNICSQYQETDDLSSSENAVVDTELEEELNPEENQSYFVKGKGGSCDLRKSYGDGELGGDEEECSGISGELSFYQSGPLFSPLKEPPQIPPSFSVDSLDDGSIHDDLILTCQANKDNYTIAFEGSYIQMSENSDYHESSSGANESTGNPNWTAERLQDHNAAPDMCHSDQPYTTWSRVSRRSSCSQNGEQISTPVRHVNSPIPRKMRQYLKEPSKKEEESKSNSMPNLMRKSLMRRSLETSGHCVKVYDLQNSLRSSQLSNCKSTDGNNFSLVTLFMKQKSLSKDAASLSSSCTDPSQEGACSTSDNQSGVESSDWPMNSQSENDMDGSTSPVPSYNQLRFIEKSRRTQSPNIMSLNEDESSTQKTQNTTGSTNNNNNMTHIDNITNQLNSIDNVNFEDSLKELNSCSKPPMTSPIREEPEGMDISIENKKALNSNPNILCLKNPKLTNKDPNCTGIRTLSSKNSFNSYASEKSKLVGDSQSSTRIRQDSGNSSSGYQSNKGSIDKMRHPLEPDCGKYKKDRPKPKPRSLKQFTDESLQTSNLKVSAGVNTSSILEKKDVYVYYPNYALPDLSFLKEKKYHVDARIFLVPQKYNPTSTDKTPLTRPKSRRPFSMNDVTKMKQNMSQIKDWESLNCLLPKDVKEILQDQTECMETHKPSFCAASKPKKRPVSHHGYVTQLTQDSKHSSSSLNSTQPSSGYRGSSTLLNDLDDDRQGSGNDAQQPLPKGVLRKCTSLRKREPNTKEELLKRRSFPEMDEASSAKELPRNTQVAFGRTRSRTLDQISLKDRRKDPQDPIRCTEMSSESGLGSSKRLSGSASDDPQPVIYDFHDKKTLVISVRSAVERLVNHFKLATSKERIRTSTNSTEAAQIALDKLCPAIYALLSDGMLPCLSSLFGKITNSVWKVIEATSQLGPSTKALNDLVMTLNSEECLSEGPLKFNAFIFGLLNLRSVDAWLSFLRTRETTLQKHYHPDSFLYLSNTAMRGLYDDLVQSLKPLALLPIQLDLLFEYKTLHASLLKMEERLAESIPSDVGTSIFDHLLAAKESKELRNAATQQDRVRALMKALSQPEPEMRRSRSNSPRPRSCCEEDVLQDIPSATKKRWSNVQLGSKLLTAIDKLMVDEGHSSSDFTDSIDNPQRREAALKHSGSSSADVSERSATDKDTENEKGLQGLLRSSTKNTSESEGERFRRLQLKWEQMAICNPKDKKDPNDRRGSDKSVSPGCVSRSRIPRPVGITSPQAAFKPFEPTKDKKSPLTKKTIGPKATPRKSLKDQDTVQPLGARAKVGRVPASATSRASSVPGRGIDRGPTSTRLVQTLHHRLATDNGHLSFNRGDLLTVVIEVDDKYLLCCHNDRKGLVPKSAVIPVHL